MVKLHDLMNINLLQDMVDQKFIRTQTHPKYGYRIYNYAETAVYAREWNEATLQCRGLIVDTDNTVLARPFPKFFNYGEPVSPVLPLHDPVVVTDKLDGSLGIMYQTPAGPAIATRGSFTSDQALHATKILWEKYDVWAEEWPEGEHTELFEVVFPANRIVVDYGDTDDLIHLGTINNADGSFALHSTFPGPRTTVFEYPTLAAALDAEPREGAEGLVVFHPETGHRVKIKQEEYMRLHKIVTGLNARAVWEALKQDGTAYDFILGLPDEFQEWAKDVADELNGEVTDLENEIISDYSFLRCDLDEDFGEGQWTRKDFAQRAAKTNHPWALFWMLDGREWKQIEDKLYDMVYPAHTWNPHGDRVIDGD